MVAVSNIWLQYQLRQFCRWMKPQNCREYYNQFVVLNKDNYKARTEERLQGVKPHSAYIATTDHKLQDE